jgi:hypothetical protein
MKVQKGQKKKSKAGVTTVQAGNAPSPLHLTLPSSCAPLILSPLFYSYSWLTALQGAKGANRNAGMVD